MSIPKGELPSGHFDVGTTSNDVGSRRWFDVGLKLGMEILGDVGKKDIGRRQHSDVIQR